MDQPIVDQVDSVMRKINHSYGSHVMVTCRNKVGQVSAVQNEHVSVSSSACEYNVFATDGAISRCWDVIIGSNVNYFIDTDSDVNVLPKNKINVNDLEIIQLTNIIVKAWVIAI